MVRRRFPWLSTLSLSVCTVMFVAGSAVSQDTPKAKPSPAGAAKPAKKPRPQEDLADPAKRKALIDKMIAEYDLTPHPPAPIPDNPPPHEGAMISLPYVVEPPDLIVVEVLDALPGRPISGERLVRPDGTISLSFYGDVPVKGLTLPQMKVAIIKHLRKFLKRRRVGARGRPKARMKWPIPELPEDANPFDRRPRRETSEEDLPDHAVEAECRQAHRSPRLAAIRRPANTGSPDRGAPQQPGTRDQPEAPKVPPQINIPAGASGRITITIDIGGQGRAEAGPNPDGQMPEMAPEPVAPDESWTIVPPEESRQTCSST